MSRQRTSDLQDGFGGGLNTIADDLSLQPNEVRVAQNAILDRFGAIEKRQGTQRIHATALPAAIDGGFSWNLAAGELQLIAANGTLYRATYGTFPVTITSVAAGLAVGAHPSFAAFRDATGYVCYIADGGQLNKYDGASLVTDIASTPALSRVVVFNQRLFGLTGQDETLYFSGLNNGDSCGVVANGGGSAIVRTFGDQRLVGLLPLRGGLALFHVSGISRYSGWTLDDINIAAGTEGITSDVGTIAPNTIVALEFGGFFLSERGAYVIDDSGVKLVSAKINDLFLGLTRSQLAGAYAVNDRRARVVRLFIPGQGVYLWRYETNAWTGPLDGAHLRINSTWEAVDDNGSQVVLLGDSSGWISKVDTGAYRDDVHSDGTSGSTYEYEVGYHRQTFQAPEIEKALRHATLFADLGDGDHLMSWVGNSAEGSQTIPGVTGAWDDSSSGWDDGGTWDGDGIVPYPIAVSGRGYFFDFTFTSTTASKARLSRFQVEGFVMGRRPF